MKNEDMGMGLGKQNAASPNVCRNNYAYRFHACGILLCQILRQVDVYECVASVLNNVDSEL